MLVVLVPLEFVQAAKGIPLVKVAASAAATDSIALDQRKDPTWLTAAELSVKKAYAQAGVGPKDLNLVELHDCFAHNELITYEALGLCPEGGAAQFIADGDNTYGGKFVTNPSGGLLSKGHPLGATGTRLLLTLVREMEQSGKALGCASACIGGGQGIAAIFERAA